MREEAFVYPAEQAAVMEHYDVSHLTGLEIRTFVREGALTVPGAVSEYGLPPAAVRAILHASTWKSPRLESEVEGSDWVEIDA